MKPKKIRVTLICDGLAIAAAIRKGPN